MKKLFLFLLISIILINACQKGPEIDKKSKQLSDIQVTACESADKAGTCDTRLAEVGIVLKEDCCKALGKCC